MFQHTGGAYDFSTTIFSGSGGLNPPTPLRTPLLQSNHIAEKLTLIASLVKLFQSILEGLISSLHLVVISSSLIPYDFEFSSVKLSIWLTSHTYSHRQYRGAVCKKFEEKCNSSSLANCKQQFSTSILNQRAGKIRKSEGENKPKVPRGNSKLRPESSIYFHYFYKNLEISDCKF